MNADQIIKESTVENLDLAKEFLKAGELSFALDQTTQAREGILNLLQFDEDPDLVGRCCRAAQDSADQQVRPTPTIEI